MKNRQFSVLFSDFVQIIDLFRCQLAKKWMNREMIRCRGKAHGTNRKKERETAREIYVHKTGMNEKEKKKCIGDLGCYYCSFEDKWSTGFQLDRPSALEGLNIGGWIETDAIAHPSRTPALIIFIF